MFSHVAKSIKLTSTTIFLQIFLTIIVYWLITTIYFIENLIGEENGLEHFWNNTRRHIVSCLYILFYLMSLLKE